MTESSNWQEIRQRVQTVAQQQVMADAGNKKGVLREFLVALSERVLVSGTTSRDICNEIGVNSSSFYNRFKRIMDVGCREYVTNVRLGIAATLVDSTRLKLRDIAELSGFASEEAMRLAYKAELGELPSDDRRARNLGFDFDDPETVARMACGELTRGEYRQLLNTLAALYPEWSEGLRPNETDDGPQDSSSDNEDTSKVRCFNVHEFEELMLEQQVFRGFLELDPKAQAKRVRRMRCHTTLLFERLHKLSRSEGRKSRQTGIRLARLALKSLHVSRDSLGESFYPAYLRGLAWLANSHRLALELKAAEEGHQEAAAFIVEHPRLKETAAHGEALWLFGSLRMIQRQLSEARQVFGQALRIYEDLGDVRGQVLVLNHRASVAVFGDDLGTALRDLRRALALVEGSDDVELIVSTLINIANCETRRGRIREAEEMLQCARRSLPVLDENSYSRLQFSWVEGFNKEACGEVTQALTLYREVVRSHVAIEEPFYAAKAKLDLALLLSKQSSLQEAGHLAAEILPVFRSLQLGRETRESLMLLQRAVARACVEETVLRRLKNALDRDPLFQVACKII